MLDEQRRVAAGGSREVVEVDPAVERICIRCGERVPREGWVLSQWSLGS